MKFHCVLLILQLALICSSSVVFLQYLVKELEEWLSGPQLVHTVESTPWKLRGILNASGSSGSW